MYIYIYIYVTPILRNTRHRYARTSNLARSFPQQFQPFDAQYSAEWHASGFPLTISALLFLDLKRVLVRFCSNRYGLTNEDLNRRWSNPNQLYHPVIYHTKGLMEYCGRVLRRPPHVFVDYHGHSRRKNVFLFGCSRSGSWSAADRAKPDQPLQYLVRIGRRARKGTAILLDLSSSVLHFALTIVSLDEPPA